MLFQVVFWVRVVPGVPGFGAGGDAKEPAAGEVNLIEDEAGATAVQKRV